MGATLLGSGWVRYAGKGETVIGRVDGRIPVQLRSIREVFNKCGIDTRISKDIKVAFMVKADYKCGDKRPYRHYRLE